MKKMVSSCCVSTHPAAPLYSTVLQSHSMILVDATVLCGNVFGQNSPFVPFQELQYCLLVVLDRLISSSITSLEPFDRRSTYRFTGADGAVVKLRQGGKWEFIIIRYNLYINKTKDREFTYTIMHFTPYNCYYVNTDVCDFLAAVVQDLCPVLPSNLG